MTQLYKSSESSHWYRPNGEPAYDADLRQARKEHLLPSVTTVLRARANYNLVNWLQTQSVLSALTLPRNPGESDDQFAKRAVADSKTEAANAANWGSRMHELCEMALSDEDGIFMDDNFGEFTTHVRSVYAWKSQNVKRVIAVEKIVVNRNDGYAGKLDSAVELKDGNKVVLDFKGRNIRNGKPEWYPEQPQQLVAYKVASGYGNDFELLSVLIDRNEPKLYFRLWTGPEQELALKRWNAVLAMWRADNDYYP